MKFCTIRIPREIKIGESRDAKSAILTQSKALNFDLFEF